MTSEERGEEDVRILLSSLKVHAGKRSSTVLFPATEDDELLQRAGVVQRSWTEELLPSAFYCHPLPVFAPNY